MTNKSYKVFLYTSMGLFTLSAFLVSILVPQTPSYVYLISAGIFSIMMYFVYAKEVRISKPVLRDERTVSNEKAAAHLTFQIIYLATYVGGIVIVALNVKDPTISIIGRTMLGIGVAQLLIYGIILGIKNRKN